MTMPRRPIVPGDLVTLVSSTTKLAMRPGFGRSRADDLDAFMFRVGPGELGLVIGHEPRPSGRVRVLVAFAAGIDSTLYDEDLCLVDP